MIFSLNLSLQLESQTVNCICLFAPMSLISISDFPCPKWNCQKSLPFFPTTSLSYSSGKKKENKTKQIPLQIRCLTICQFSDYNLKFILHPALSFGLTKKPSVNCHFHLREMIYLIFLFYSFKL